MVAPLNTLMHSLGKTLWRTVVLWALMFWQGGFLFYSAAVVPMAQDEIGHRQQGFITRHVTVWLNYSAVVSLALLAVDQTLFPESRRWPRRSGWGVFALIAACQIALFVLHPQMNALLDRETLDVARGFRPLHRTYLWVHTVQWAFAIALTALTVARWRSGDAASQSAANEGPNGDHV